MPSEDQQRRLEREQTDESLRTEREKADQTLEDSAIDETADAVISRARSRADKVLAASRAKTLESQVAAVVDQWSYVDGAEAGASALEQMGIDFVVDELERGVDHDAAL